MNISEKLTPKRFQEILLFTYAKGQESETIKVSELIEEIKQQVLFEK